MTSDDYSITLAAAPANTAAIVHFAPKDRTAISATVCPKAETKDEEASGREELGEENRCGRQRGGETDILFRDLDFT